MDVVQLADLSKRLERKLKVYSSQPAFVSPGAPDAVSFDVELMIEKKS